MRKHKERTNEINEKILGASLLIILIGFLFVFVLLNTEVRQARQAAEKVLENVIAKDFDVADDTPNLKPATTQESGKALWLERIKDWKTARKSLLAYENLKINKDDRAL